MKEEKKPLTDNELREEIARLQEIATKKKAYIDWVIQDSKDNDTKLSSEDVGELNEDREELSFLEKRITALKKRIK